MSANVDSSDSLEHLEFNLRFAIQSLPDKKIRCPSNWTVLQLKEFLQEECSSKPTVDKQRLIYAGHCLKNEQVLKEIFNRNVDGIANGDSAGLQVVHLVCASNEQLKAAKQLSGNEGVRNRQQPSSSNPQLTSADVFVPSEAPIFNDVPQDVNQAYAQAYHNYLRTYYSRSQQVGGGAQFGIGRTLGSQITLMTGVQNAAPNQQIPVAAENNAVRAPEVNDHPDFLDLVYKLVRFAFLAAVVFYSALDRIIFVIAVICLMWYVQMRREQNNRNVVQNERPENVNQEQAQNPPQPANPQNGNDSNNNELPVAAAPPATEPQGINAWSVFWSTVVSFFSSLIP